MSTPLEPTGGIDNAETVENAIELREVNWLVPPPEGAPLHCRVKLRAREAPQAAAVRSSPDGTSVMLAEAALAAPGQAEYE